MAKTWQGRINDTIGYVVGRLNADANVVDTFLKNSQWINNQAIGNAMSIGGSDQSAAAKLLRKKKRALIMLEQEVRSPPRAPAILKTFAGPQLDTELDKSLFRIRLVASQSQYGDGSLLQSEFNRLKLSTRRFLNENALHIFGSDQDNGLLNVVTSHFWYKKDGTKFIIKSTKDGFIPNPHSFQSVSVLAVPWCNVPGRTHNPAAGSFATIAANELTGANVMISTQFSGCSFCFKQSAGRLFAAHIMPDDSDPQAPKIIPGAHGMGGGQIMARQLANKVPAVTGGDFGAPAPAGGAFKVYGAGYSNINGLGNGYPAATGGIDKWMTVFGVNRGGSWRIYTQHVNGAQLKVHRLFPRP